jgi:HlyD family secretion protein
VKKPVVVVIIAVVVVAGYGIRERVLRLSDHDRLWFSGNIELTEARLGFKRAGRLEQRFVDEGDTVASGTVIARLDTAELESQRERARASVVIAEARLGMLDKETRLAEETLSSTLDSRRAELGQAEAALAELLSGSRKEEIADAQAASERASTERDLAQSDWDRVRELFTASSVSASERDAARTRFMAAQALLDQAKQKFALVREGTRSERIDAARALVEKAKAGVRAAQTLRLEVDLKKLERPVREADLEKARADLAVIETQLDDSLITAPMDGVVLTKSAEPGEILAAGTPVLTLGDMDHPWVRAYVGEPDLGRVKLGDRVQVKTDSRPGKVYDGTLTFIASDAEFTPKQIQTREERTRFVYRVKISLPNPEHELKLNMPVEGTIVPGRETK